LADGDEYRVFGDNFGVRPHVHAVDEVNLVWLEVEDQPTPDVVEPTPVHHLATWEDMYYVSLLPIGNVELFGRASQARERCRDDVHFKPLKARLFHTINLHFSQSQVFSPARNHNVDVATFHPSATEGFGDSSSNMNRSTQLVAVSMVAQRISNADLSSIESV